MPNLRSHSVISVMAGTAGHVDHGKTALVKLLTGCDTDTLPEEKERGMSIDLGFAPCVLPGSRMIGLIDVPGHEDFIRNMVAGATAIDVLIFVIAADDGIMPQTLEHLSIVRLLKIPRLMVALTKVDLVNEDLKKQRKEEILSLFSEKGDGPVPIIDVSNKTGEGISEVRECLDSLVKSLERPIDPFAFRMNIEKFFSVQGHGSVVTGIPLSGRITTGEWLELFPEGKPYYVKSLQRYKQSSEETEAHVCSAINLRDLELSRIQRGMTLAVPGAYKISAQVTVSIKNISGSEIKNGAEIRFHCGTFSTLAKIRFLLIPSLKKGEAGFARIFFKTPFVVSAGDRFILRSLSPSMTLGGGQILSIRESKKKWISSRSQEYLNAARKALEHHDRFTAELFAGPDSLLANKDLFWLSSGAHSRPETLKEKENSGLLTKLGASHWLIGLKKEEFLSDLKKQLERFHKAAPLEKGMSEKEVLKSLRLPPDAMDDLKVVFRKDPDLEVESGVTFLKSFRPALNRGQSLLCQGIMEALRASPNFALAAGDLLNLLKAEKSVVTPLLDHLKSEKQILIIKNYVFDLKRVNAHLMTLKNLFDSHEIVTIADFKNATNLPRSLAIPILEMLDEKGITRRKGEGRIMVKSLDPL